MKNGELRNILSLRNCQLRGNLKRTIIKMPASPMVTQEGSSSLPAATEDLSQAGSNMYAHGQATGYGYPTFVYKDEEECDTGVSPTLALATVGLLLGASFFIFRQVTNPGMVGRRRKREEDLEGNFQRKRDSTLFDGAILAGQLIVKRDPQCIQMCVKKSG